MQSRIDDMACDYFVEMTSYVNRSYPGVLLGGATRVVLDETTIPVLMSH